MLKGRANDVKQHPWFAGLDWIALAARKVETPRQPKDDSAKRLKELQVSPLRSCVCRQDQAAVRSGQTYFLAYHLGGSTQVSSVKSD